MILCENCKHAKYEKETNAHVCKKFENPEECQYNIDRYEDELVNEEPWK